MTNRKERRTQKAKDRRQFGKSKQIRDAIFRHYARSHWETVLKDTPEGKQLAETVGGADVVIAAISDQLQTGILKLEVDVGEHSLVELWEKEIPHNFKIRPTEHGWNIVGGMQVNGGGAQ